MGFKKKRLGDILLDRDLITQKELEQALAKQKESDKRLGKQLVDLDFISEEEIAQALNQQLGVLLLSKEDKESIDSEAVNLVDENYIRQERVFPIRLEGQVLILAMEDPQDILVRDEVEQETGFDVIPRIATSTETQRLIDKYLTEESIYQFIENIDQIDFEQFVDESEEEDEEATELEEGDSTLVNIVNKIIKTGIQYKASDIHIEPTENMTRVRYRIDGVLHKLMQFPKKVHPALISRIKVMSGLDIAEKRKAQDGRINADFDDVKADLRISTLPFTLGEKVVIRIFDKTNVNLDFDFIGFSKKNLKRFKSLVKRPNGIILLTGPTGSGKTTTLYTALNYLNQESKNIVTIEEPVEYQLEGVNQATVNEKKDFTFARVLRIFVRQDPDIIMVGEIRDKETAETAIKAALTGHLVFSTLHTNSAAGTISRLINMGVEPFLLADSIIGVVAQRLVRRVCPECKVISKKTKKYQFLADNWQQGNQIYQSQGCDVCNDIGYKGRTAIHELLVVNDEIKTAIIKKESSSNIEAIAKREGMKTLLEDGLRQIKDGTTTLEEVVKVANI